MFQQFKGGLEYEIAKLYFIIDIGATGAPTISRAKGLASITRSAQGIYDLVLEDKYWRLLHVNVIQLEASAEDLTFQVEDSFVDAATPGFNIICKTGATATDPSSGSQLLIEVTLGVSAAGG
jgi:hypothetical protein